MNGCSLKIKAWMLRCLIFVLGLGILGCASTEEQSVWSPPPKVLWTDLAPYEPPPVENGYIKLESGPSRGRFPATIAVTRIAVEGEAEQGARKTFIPPKPKNEFLDWNSAFDDQMAINCVFPIETRDLGGGPVIPEQINAAFHALDGEIGLIYAWNYLEENKTEMFGVLYDTDSAKPIAALHASATSVPIPEDAEEPVDLWEFDSKALVREKFQKIVHACVRELILGDIPQTVDVPKGWVPHKVESSVVWPPNPSSTP